MNWSFCYPSVSETGEIAQWFERRTADQVSGSLPDRSGVRLDALTNNGIQDLRFKITLLSHQRN